MNKREQKTWVNVLKLLANIVSWTLLTLLILVAGFLLYYVITTQIYSIKGEKYAPKFSLYTIISPSMTPNINVYDIVIDERVDNYDDLKVDDVITFVSTSSISSGMTITHRIVDIIETPEGTKYKTKGDANISPDSTLVTQDKILGKVKLRVPQLGRIQFFLSSKGGWLFIILIPAIVIVLLDILKLFKIIKIKHKVDQIEEEAATEEDVSQAELIAEHKKQLELKRQLQNKNNRDKFRRNKYEPEHFYDEEGPVVIKVKEQDELSDTQEVIFNNANEIPEDIVDPNTIAPIETPTFEHENIDVLSGILSSGELLEDEEVKEEDSKYEEVSEDSVITGDDDIFESAEDFMNDIPEIPEATEEDIEITEPLEEEIIDESSIHDEVDNTTFEDFIKEMDELEVIPNDNEFNPTPVEEVANVSQPEVNDDIKSKLAALDFDDEEEFELPKKIEIKEQEIPDDIELPTLDNKD